MSVLDEILCNAVIFTTFYRRRLFSIMYTNETLDEEFAILNMQIEPKEDM